MVAAPFAAIISDRFGRRKGMFAGAAVIIIGAVIATTSKHIAQVSVWRTYGQVYVSRALVLITRSVVLFGTTGRSSWPG
jgi:MFS family permease